MAFEYRRHLLGLTTGAVIDKGMIINNSETITFGDSVQLDGNGHVIVGTAGEEVLGVVIGIIDANGNNITSPAADVDGTVSGTGLTLTYVSAADNETDKKVRAQVMVDKNAEFYNDSSGTLAQTNLLQFFDLASESQIDASSASDTNGQFQLIEIDPDGDGDASKGLFKIAESQLDPYTQG